MLVCPVIFLINSCDKVFIGFIRPFESCTTIFPNSCAAFLSTGFDAVPGDCAKPNAGIRKKPIKSRLLFAFSFLMFLRKSECGEIKDKNMDKKSKKYPK